MPVVRGVLSHPLGILRSMGVWVETVRLTAKLSSCQHRRMDQVFAMSAELYNACLESWRGTYAWWREHHPDPDEKFPSELAQSHFDRMRMFTGVREDRPEWAAVSVKVGRGVLRRFDRTVQSFYKRCADGKRPGFPRFKPSRRWRSVEIVDASPGMLSAPGTSGNGSDRWWRLRVKGIPRLRFTDKGHRLEKALGVGAVVKELRVVRTPLRTELHVVLRHPPRVLPVRPICNPVGIDKGLEHRMTLSDGTRVSRPGRSTPSPSSSGSGG